jgi:hypothetical protein
MARDVPPPPPSRQRTIEAPDGEWFTNLSAAGYLCLTLGEFADRVSLECMPPGSAASLRNDQWSWQQLVAISWLRPYFDRMYAEKKREQKGRNPKAKDEPE